VLVDVFDENIRCFSADETSVDGGEVSIYHTALRAGLRTLRGKVVPFIWCRGMQMFRNQAVMWWDRMNIGVGEHYTPLAVRLVFLYSCSCTTAMMKYRKTPQMLTGRRKAGNVRRFMTMQWPE